MHVKKGDKVIIIAGRDKGKTGTIIQSFPSANKVMVEGLNIVKKHQKPNALNPDGGIIEQEAKLDASNVMHIDPSTGKGTRVKTEITADGKKKKIAVKSGKEIS